MPLFLLTFASAHASILDEPDATIYGGAGWFGYDDAAVGDLNGDGFDDFAVASPLFGAHSGRVYVYLGGETGPTLQTFLQGAEQSWFGTDVAAGDVNGDGYDDLLVGTDPEISPPGVVELYFGSADGLETTASATWIGLRGGKIGDGLSVVDVDLDGYGDAVFCDAEHYEVHIHRGGASVPSARPDYRLRAPGFSYFGAAPSVVPADVNGDGYQDLVVAASNSGWGSVHVFESASGGPSSTPDTSIVGYEPFGYAGWFGYGMASTDTDGDGYEDLIVGAPATAAGDGRVYVFRGSASGLETVRAATLEAETPMVGFGSTLGAGDVDGDGFGDVVVGTGPEGNGATVYAFLGASGGIATTAANVITEGPPSDDLGIALAVADVDGDGRGDALVGDRYGGDGAVQVYFGVWDGLGPESLVVSPELYVPNFGSNISAAGDVNGDGFADLLISGNHSEDGGVVFLHLGSSDGVSAFPALTLEGTGDVFGETGAVGDVDGDGLDDVVVGAPYADKALVYYGNATFGLGRIPTVLTGTAGTYFGRAVASAGDVNGDGFGDVAVGAHYAAADNGEVYVYLGSATGLETTGTVLALPRWSAAENMGLDVDSAGDVDGDGYGDLIVGAYYSAFLFRGGPLGIRRRAATEFAAPPTGLNLFAYGNEVAGAGDVNGDGYDDVVFSWDTADLAYLALGGPSGMSGIPDTTFTGMAGGVFGSELDGALDFDADGYSDLLIGEPPPYSDPGHANVYAGGPSGPSTDATTVMVGLSEWEKLGVDVAALGDANGDGYDDVAIGTTQNVVRIYYGRTRDNDGDGIPSPDDCDDLDPAVHPGALEVVGDEVDQNCNGHEQCFVDADDDGCRTWAPVRSNDTDCSDPGEARSRARRDRDDADPTPRTCMRP